MKKTLMTLAIISPLLSVSALSQEPPAFDCTATETRIYIEQVTHKVFAPSNIANPVEFKDAYTQKKQAEADAGDGDAQSCVTIFSDGQLNEDWKELVDTIRNIDIDVSFSPDGAALKALLDQVKSRIKKEVTDAMSQLGQDVCAMLSSEKLEKLLLNSVNDKYGLNARSLRIDDFSKSITDQAMMNAPDNIQMLLSEDQFYKEVSGETRNELRKVRKDLWDGF